MSSPTDIHAMIAERIKSPGCVWCRMCGRSRSVDAATCLARGWPKCCGYTMTIDRPEGSPGTTEDGR